MRTCRNETATPPRRTEPLTPHGPASWVGSERRDDLLAELLVWRRIALTSLFTAVIWWLLVAFCVADSAVFELRPGFDKLRGTADTADAPSLFRDHRRMQGTVILWQPVRNPGLPEFLTSSVLDDADSDALNGQFSPLPDDDFSETSGQADTIGQGEFSPAQLEDASSLPASVPPVPNGIPAWEAELAEPPSAVNRIFGAAHSQPCPDYGWHVLPPGLLYRSYLAGEKEPRINWTSLYDTKSERQVWETALGGRAGLLRYGTGGLQNPQGFQWDLEGAVFARVLPDEPSSMLEAADFRVGTIGTWREGRLAWKAGYYHISSHLGDEFLLQNPTFPRINYVRDSLIAGVMYDLTEATQIYGEIGNAIGAQGGAKPLELQFGAQYTPIARVPLKGAPYAAINGHLRQDFDFGGAVNIQTGWGWQGVESKYRFRAGLQYYNGPSMQYSLFDRRENLIGGGLWFDF